MKSNRRVLSVAIMAALVATPGLASANFRMPDFIAMSKHAPDGSGEVYLDYGDGNRFKWTQASFGEPVVHDEAFGSAIAWGDFNGDGNDDLVIGVPNKTFGGGAQSQLGEIHILFGHIAGSQTISPLTPGFCQDASGCVFQNEHFGYAVAAGDFNGDGVDDLAVGAPGTPEGGRVYIVYGQRNVLPMSFFLTHDITLGTAGFSTSRDASGNPVGAFGEALATGDLDCNGSEDLAVGAPGQAASGVTKSGAVFAFYGGGFLWQHADAWTQDGGLNATTGSLGDIRETTEPYDKFGSVLAIGNFNGDSANGHACNDLAIGVPSEDVGNATDAGVIQVIYGGTNRLHAAGNQLYHQDIGAMNDSVEASDRFGSALSISGSAAVDDLIIGIPGEDHGSGAVAYMYGTVASALTDVGNQFFQDGDVGFRTEPGDQFGAAVGSSSTDLLVGSPYETTDSGIIDAGHVVQFSTVAPNTFHTLYTSLTWGEAEVDWAEFGVAITGNRAGR